MNDGRSSDRYIKPPSSFTTTTNNNSHTAATNSSILSKNCTNFQKPTFYTILIQIIFHMIGGILYYYSTNSNKSCTMTMICCIILSNATLITMYVININHTKLLLQDLPHELNIRTMKKNQPMTNDMMGVCRDVQMEIVHTIKQSKLLFIWIMTPIVISVMMFVLVDKKMDGTNVTTVFSIRDMIQLFISTSPKVHTVYHIDKLVLFFHTHPFLSQPCVSFFLLSVIIFYDTLPFSISLFFTRHYF